MRTIEDNLPHEVAELICLNCHQRWIGVYPQKTPLKNIECTCGVVGMVIKTGQTLPEENQCEDCSHNKNGRCTLKLSMDSDFICEYKKQREEEKKR